MIGVVAVAAMEMVNILQYSAVQPKMENFKLRQGIAIMAIIQLTNQVLLFLRWAELVSDGDSE